MTHAVLDSVVGYGAYTASGGAVMPTMTIGQVARQAGVGIETVRFYEREGLLEEPDRKESGYRVFESGAVRRLRFIKRAKELGFTLKEIKGLILLGRDDEATRADLKDQALSKISLIDAKIADLQRIRSSLAHLAGECDGHGPVAGCPIWEALNEPG